MSFSSMLITSATPWAGYTALSPTLNSTSGLDCMNVSFDADYRAARSQLGTPSRNRMILKLVSIKQLRTAPSRVVLFWTRAERIGHELHSSGVYARLGNARVSGSGLPQFLSKG